MPVSPGKAWGMQSLRPHLRPSKSGALEQGPGYCFNRASRRFLSRRACCVRFTPSRVGAELSVLGVQLYEAHRWCCVKETPAQRLTSRPWAVALLSGAVPGRQRLPGAWRLPEVPLSGPPYPPVQAACLEVFLKQNSWQRSFSLSFYHNFF